MAEFGVDSLPPPQMARRVEGVGAAKADLDALSMFVLALLAGAFIALGASFDTVAVSGSGEMAFGVKKVLSGLVFSGRFVGSIGAAVIVFFASYYRCGDAAVGLTALRSDNRPVHLGFVPAVALGVMCNVLVCLAVWLTISARTTVVKVAAIVLPITAFGGRL